MKKKYELFNAVEKGLLVLMFLVLTLVTLLLYDALEASASQKIQSEQTEFSKADIELLERVCMSEAGISSSDEKQAIVTTILNRLRSGIWGNTLEEVIYYPNAYSTQDNGEPTAECHECVMAAINNPCAFPSNMYYFRTDKYHSFGYEYCHIGNTYFSLNDKNATWSDVAFTIEEGGN